MPSILLLVWWPWSEHSISLRSWANIANICRSLGYQLHIVAGNQANQWSLVGYEAIFEPLLPSWDQSWTSLASILQEQKTLLTDVVVFPALHGPFGEWGVVQWLCESLRMKYVWCDGASSALCMDKARTKALVTSIWIPVCPWIVWYTRQPKPQRSNVVSQYSFPLFVKPARNGSSVWVSKCFTPHEFDTALDEASKRDTKVLIEQNGCGWLEVECGIVGYGTDIVVSSLGAITTPDFYSYDQKYSATSSATILIPAPVSDAQKSLIQRYAYDAFVVCWCRGLARIDFFVSSDGTIYLNEINTMPWRTSISLYPKMFEHDGMTPQHIIQRLIHCAMT